MTSKVVSATEVISDGAEGIILESALEGYAEFMTFWLHRFRKLDVRQKSHRKMLIDTFINAIFLYDDKMVIIVNYKDGTDTVTFDDLKTALADKKTGSDLDCFTAPKTAIF